MYPTQPFPTKPPPLGPQGVSLDDANDMTPEIKQLAQEQMKRFKLGPLFTPKLETLLSTTRDGVYEAATLIYKSRAEILSDVAVEGEEFLRRALERGRGVIALSAHIGHFALIGARLAAEHEQAHEPGEHQRVRAGLEGDAVVIAMGPWSILAAAVVAVALVGFPVPAFSAVQDGAGAQDNGNNALRRRGEAALAEAREHAAAGRWRSAADAYSTALNATNFACVVSATFRASVVFPLPGGRVFPRSVTPVSRLGPGRRSPPR